MLDRLEADLLGNGDDNRGGGGAARRRCAERSLSPRHAQDLLDGVPAWT